MSAGDRREITSSLVQIFLCGEVCSGAGVCCDCGWDSFGGGCSCCEPCCPCSCTSMQDPDAAEQNTVPTLTAKNPNFRKPACWLIQAPILIAEFRGRTVLDTDQGIVRIGPSNCCRRSRNCPRYAYRN